MTRYFFVFSLATLFSFSVAAEKGKNPKKVSPTIDSVQLEIDRFYLFQDSVNKVLTYQTGRIPLPEGNAMLSVPAGFKFVGSKEANFIITQVWGNPEHEDVLGIIFPERSTPFSDSSFAFVVTYNAMGYVKDDDASEINYDDMLKEIREEEGEDNKIREAAGYDPIHMIGWAQKPFYDDKRKVLHWAKNLRFGDAESNTLNYDVRVLGRNGVLSLNAVASMSELGLVKQNIDKVLSMASFSPGYTYSDFKSGTDNVAAYTIGGLVAGKVLAKVGFFAVLAKFSKVIIAALVGAFVFVKKKFFGKDKDADPISTEELVPGNEA